MCAPTTAARAGIQCSLAAFGLYDDAGKFLLRVDLESAALRPNYETAYGHALAEALRRLPGNPTALPDGYRLLESINQSLAGAQGRSGRAGGVTRWAQAQGQPAGPLITRRALPSSVRDWVRSRRAAAGASLNGAAARRSCCALSR